MSLNQLVELLSPPGEGVFTVHTAKERKEGIQKAIYPQGSEDIYQSWKKSLEAFWNQPTNIALLGVCSDSGGGILRGANWGPLFIRDTLLKDGLNQRYFDLGDIRVIPHLLHDKYLNQETIKNCRRSLYQDENSPLPVSPLSMSEYALDLLYEKNPELKVISLGGDHSVSYPLVKSFLKARNKQNKRVGLIHFDAHTDLLKERLGIDYCFGSWCTHILADLVDPSCLVQIGIRSSGKEKSHWEKNFGVKQFWAKESKDLGAKKLSEIILDHLKSLKLDELYISFDIDALDNSFASATGTPESEGLSPDFAVEVIQRLLKEYPLTGADLVEVAPFLKTQESLNPEPQSTLMCASSIITSFLDAMKG